MKEFLIVAKVSVSVYTKVKAETIEEAMKIAEDRDMMEIVHDGSPEYDTYWILEEIDGTPYDFEEG